MNTDITIAGCTYFVDVHPEDVRLQTLVAKHYAACTCQKCKKDKGSESMPCPYCESPTSRPKAVKVKPNYTTQKTVKIESQTIPGQFYSLTVRDGKAVACTCPGFKYHRACKHKDGYGK